MLVQSGITFVCTAVPPSSHPAGRQQTEVDGTSRSDDAVIKATRRAVRLAGSGVSLLERQLPSLSPLSLPQRALLLAPSHAPEPASHVHTIR